MRYIPVAHPLGALRASKFTPGKFVIPTSGHHFILLSHRLARMLGVMHCAGIEPRIK